MRRTLMYIVAILVFATAYQARADHQVAWSGGAEYSSETPQSGIFSRIELHRKSTPFVKSCNLIGAWFSTSGILPVWPQGLDVDVYGDFPGFRKIEKVELSNDDFLTCWLATPCPGKGWKVRLPYLPTGSHGLQWRVKSRDKKNRVMIVIIPINWTSKRSASAGNHVMIQSAAKAWDDPNRYVSDLEVYAHTRGFISSWSFPDVGAVIAQQQSTQLKFPTYQVGADGNLVEIGNGTYGNSHNPNGNQPVQTSNSTVPNEEIQYWIKVWQRDTNKYVKFRTTLPRLSVQDQLVFEGCGTATVISVQGNYAEAEKNTDFQIREGSEVNAVKGGRS